MQNPFFSNSDESSDDDLPFIVENIPKNRQYLNSPDFFESLSEYEFRSRFRLGKGVILNLAELLDPILGPRKRSTRHAISTMNQLLLTMRFYATGAFQQVTGDLFNVSQSVVSTVVNRTTIAICSLRQNFIKMPTTPEELAAIKQQFYRMIRPHGIPNVIGLIDGTHCKIYSPGGVDAERFRNRKGYFSINVQVVGGPDLKVLDIEARWPGSAHDSYIYDMSCIKMRFLRGDFANCFLLGDSGYGNSRHMLTPLTSPASPADQAYQRAHISTRNAVERLFGVAKRRFPSLALGLQIDVKTSLLVIVACFTLHNLAIINNDPYDDFEHVQKDESVSHVENIDPQNPDSRNHIIHNYF